MFVLLAVLGLAFADIPEVDGAPHAAVDATIGTRAALATARAARIDALRAYAARGVFPRNATTPGFASILIDDAGHPCAMAALVIESGHGGLVTAQAAADNAFTFAEATSGPLHAWLFTSGLTQEEAAFIQEPDFQIAYDLPEPLQDELIASEQRRLRAHFLAAALQLEVYGEASLDVAVARLEARRSVAPPAR